MKVGDLEKGMEDVVHSLERAMTELNLMDIASGDPKCLETLMKKLNVNFLLYMYIALLIPDLCTLTYFG